MDRIRIIGGKPLKGSIPISGAKNAALPLMIASLADRRPADAEKRPEPRRRQPAGAHICAITASISPSTASAPGPVRYLGETFHLTARDIVDTTAPYEMVSRMRASFWVLGPLLARMRQAKVSLPGGCAIGTRPVDLHLMGLKALGAEIDIEGGYVLAEAPKRLARRPYRISQSLGRRDAQRPAGGGACQGRDRDRERGARARDRRRRRLPRQDGRQRSKASAPRRCAFKAATGLKAPSIPCSPIASRPALSRWRWQRPAVT